MLLIPIIILVASFYFNVTDTVIDYEHTFTLSDTLFRFHRYSWFPSEIIFYTDGKFIHNFTSDIGAGGRKIQGNFERKGATITLFIQYDSYKVQNSKIESWYLIQWDSTELLLPERGMLEFCNDYNAGLFSMPSWDSLYLLPLYYHMEDTLRHEPSYAPAGIPNLPRPWNNYLLTRPITGKIISISSSSNEATLNVGSSHGVYEGCDFYGPRSIFVNHGFTVSKVYSDSSIIKPELNEDLKRTQTLREEEIRRGTTQIIVESLDTSIADQQRLLDTVMGFFQIGMVFRTQPFDN